MRRTIKDLMLKDAPRYFRDLRRVLILGRAATITLTVSAATVIIPLYAIWIADQYSTTYSGDLSWLISLRAIPAGLLIFVLLLSLSILEAGFSLRYLPPDVYARIKISGRNPSEVIRIISLEISKLCRQFLAIDSKRYLWSRIRFDKLQCVSSLHRPLQLRRERFIHTFFISLGNDIDACKENMSNRREILDFYSKNERILTKSLRVLSKLQRAHHARIQRLIALKRAAAVEIEVPQRRLCEHLLAYSPRMHRLNLRKYTENAKFLLDMMKLWLKEPENGLIYEEDEVYKRFRGLVQQNVRICNSAFSTLQAQEELQAYEYLHDYIHRLASQHSTSASLKSYTSAITTILYKNQTDDPKIPVSERVRNQFRFIADKQKAHPGFDLHQLLKSACRNGHLLQGSKILDELITAVPKRLYSATREETLATQEHRGSGYTVGQIQLLAGLEAEIGKVVDQSRTEIHANFDPLFQHWLKAGGSSHYLLTHGYSKTVREILSRSIRAVCQEDASQRLPDIFVIGTEDNAFDARLMSTELKENLAIFRDQLRIGIGDERLLMGMLKPGADIMVVLGAECFDDAYRVVHPRGMEGRLAELRRKALQMSAQCLVVVVAEGYKYQKNLVNVHAFYCHDLDRISLYPGDLVNTVVSDFTLLRRREIAELENLPDKRRRKHRRIKTLIPCAVSRNGRKDQAWITDLSFGGARITPLEKVSNSIYSKLPARISLETVEEEMCCFEARLLGSYDDEGEQYGIQFLDSETDRKSKTVSFLLA